MRRWYDLPMTIEEIVAAQSHVTLIAGENHSKSGKPTIDSVEVFCCPKDEVEMEMEILRQTQAKNSKTKATDGDEIVLGGEKVQECAINYSSFSLFEKTGAQILELLSVLEEDWNLLPQSLLAKMSEEALQRVIFLPPLL